MRIMRNLSSRLMVISKSIELFIDTHCHTMLVDREAFLSHGRISRNNFLVNLVDIATSPFL